MGFYYSLSSTGFCGFVDGLIVFDCPVDRIKHEPMMALKAMEMIQDYWQRKCEQAEMMAEHARLQNEIYTSHGEATTKAQEKLMRFYEKHQIVTKYKMVMTKPKNGLDVISSDLLEEKPTQQSLDRALEFYGGESIKVEEVEIIEKKETAEEEV